MRSSRGGATIRWQEARREWRSDYEAFQYWLYNKSGGEISRGFWLPKISYETATSDQRWLVCLHNRIAEELSTSNFLALAFYIFEAYNDWPLQHGLDRRRGVAHGRQVIESGDLPAKRIINQRVLGVDNPR